MKRTLEEKAAFAELKKYGKMFNVKICEEVDSGCRELTAETPKGFCFGCGLHQYVDVVYTPWFPDYVDMKNRIEGNGIVPCEVEDCEWCNSEY